MISLERCKDVLNKKKDKYTNEEVKEIRDFLCLLAGIQYEVEKSNKNSTI